ncbi:unnamed protein product [Didymodactylos carnosus]|uniref:Uncharacterized protein n=1 Tax=Didymodactylos carnosus TaxID=1234261 RepID=A0A813VCD6_9BILA|nr:unnamed protein product [Didymodactylos carnosus]CAF1240924.1 unnamed protein product [Didymodactylos carnosus]CAF3621799.1 unnamed protein product [Didymodactylos carnosus]CAF4048397.1 unnamed protein product [Didymodactylos carnosus]
MYDLFIIGCLIVFVVICVSLLTLQNIHVVILRNPRFTLDNIDTRLSRILLNRTLTQIFLNSTLCGRIITNPSKVSLTEINQANLDLFNKYGQIKNKNYFEITCQQFIDENKFYKKSITKMEYNFPLAFSILIYKDLYQFQVLLRTVYREHNYHCIHVDLHAPKYLYYYAQKASKCLKHVYVTPKRIKVAWGTYSTLEAERICQVYLLERFKSWKYYMNLAGTELPIHTNYELVQVLKLLNGRNDVISHPNSNPQRHRRKRAKIPIPFQMRLWKGEFHVTLSRAFVEYIYQSPMAMELLFWLNNTGVPDEYFYNSLNRLSDFPGHSNVGYKIDQFLTRYKVWKYSTKFSCKSAIYINSICQLNWKDLQRVTNSKRLFANKFNQNKDFLSIDCMEQWLQVKTDDRMLINPYDYTRYPPVWTGYTELMASERQRIEEKQAFED